MLKLTLLSVIFYSSLNAQDFHKYSLVTWGTLQELQKDSLLSIKTLRLSTSCPESLDELMASYSYYPTTIKKIFGTIFIWTEFYNTNSEICVVKHLKVESLKIKNINPTSYLILNTLEARVLLSASVSFGFKDKGLNNEALENELIKIRNKDNLMSEKQLEFYGGFRIVHKYIKLNKPITNAKELKFNNNLTEGPTIQSNSYNSIIKLF